MMNAQDVGSTSESSSQGSTAVVTPEDRVLRGASAEELNHLATIDLSPAWILGFMPAAFFGYSVLSYASRFGHHRSHNVEITNTEGFSAVIGLLLPFVLPLILASVYSTWRMLASQYLTFILILITGPLYLLFPLGWAWRLGRVRASAKLKLAHQTTTIVETPSAVPSGGTLPVTEAHSQPKASEPATTAGEPYVRSAQSNEQKSENGFIIGVLIVAAAFFVLYVLPNAKF